MISLFDSTLTIYIGVIAIGVIVIALGAFIAVKKSQKAAFFKARSEAHNDILNALGGRENIVSCKASGSRISFSLVDYSLVNNESLKKLGVSSILKMSNKITLVIGEEAKEIEQLLIK